MHIVRIRPMPPAGLSLVLLAGVVALAPRLYSTPRAHGAEAIPGLTYEMQRGTARAPALLIVTSVEDGSAAARAGIAAGDVIDGIDGKPVGSLAAVARAVRVDRGRGVTLDIRHAGMSRYKHLPARRGVEPGTPHVAKNTRHRG